jgi:hypothetical protein
MVAVHVEGLRHPHFFRIGVPFPSLLDGPVLVELEQREVAENLVLHEKMVMDHLHNTYYKLLYSP